MSLFFPYGLNSICITTDYESELGRFTTMIPLITKIIKENDLNKNDILVCEYWVSKQKLKYFWGNPNIIPTNEIEALRVSRDDLTYFIFFTEDFYIKQKLIDYVSKGGFNGE